jgi:hypothetical protein
VTTLWAIGAASPGGRRVAMRDSVVSRARGAPATGWDLASAATAAVADAPGVALLLIWCFTTLTGVAPMAFHYAYLMAMDFTSKDVAAARRAGAAGRSSSSTAAAGGLVEAARNAARNCGAALFGPLPASRVWPRRGSGGALAGSSSQGDMAGAAPSEAELRGTGDAEEGGGAGSRRGSAAAGGAAPQGRADTFTLE